MNIVLFLITIIISFVIVRVGAVAFEITGLDWTLAKFQALSCFTGTGFTTKEAELVVGNPQRRRIAVILMILGNAGLVTLIATFANSLNPNIVLPKFNIPFLDLIIPNVVAPFVNFIIIAAAVYGLFRFYARSKYVKKFTDYFRNLILKKQIIQPVSFEDLVVSTGGFGISSVDITGESPVLGLSLRQLGLTSHHALILAILRNGDVLTNPGPENVIKDGDKLICYGKPDTFKKIFGIG